MFLLEVIKRTLLMISTNSSFVVVCCIMTDFYKYQKPLHDFKFFKPDKTHGCWPFWIQQNHGVNVSSLLMAATLEVRERICRFMWCLCSCKKSSLSPSWIFLAITSLPDGFRSPWISSWIFHDLTHLIPFWWWWIISRKWFTLFLATNQ